jgi:hypothetical protein
MPQTDWYKERKRLAGLYSGMEDGELEKIAADAIGLTEVAWETLRAEMLRRGLAAPAEETNPVLASAGARKGTKKTESPRLMVVQRYRDMGPALIGKSILDSAGVESFLFDDNVLRMDWLMSNAIGGIKLLVPNEDAEAAKALLEQSAPESFDWEGVGEYVQPKCPKCGSLDVSFEELDRKMAHLGLFLKVPMPVTVKGWTCHGCGHAWEPDAADVRQEGDGAS